MNNVSGRRFAQVTFAVLLCASLPEPYAQVADNALSGRVFHPNMANDGPSTVVTKAEEDATDQIRQSLEGGAYCALGVCIEAPPLPSSPASEVIDFVAEQKFNSYVQTVMKIERCTNETCAEQVVDQAVGVTKLAPENLE